MRRADLDLKLLALVAGAGLVAGLAIDQPGVRVVPAALLVLVAPGYALSLVLFPWPRDPAERWLLAIGLSLAIAVVSGLGLYLVRIPLDSRSWSIALALLTLVLTAVARRRRVDRRREARPTEPSTPPDPAVARSRLGLGLAGAAVLALLVAAVLIARQPAGSAHVRGYSVLWALPGKTTGSSFRFTVGVRSAELRTQSYRLVGAVGGRVVYARQITLRPGTAWTGSGELRQPQAGLGFVEPVRLRLYRAGHLGVPYRHVFVSPGGVA